MVSDKEQLSELLRELEEANRKIEKLEKINNSLLTRVKKSINSTGSAYSVFERNILLDQEVQKKTEALVKERDRAEQADRAKSQFLANMSHELRTPMNGIIGLTEILLEEGLNNKQEDLARSIFDSADLLLRIINDILDFSKIDAGKLDICIGSFSLEQLLKRVECLITPELETRNLTFIVEHQGKIPKELFGDEIRIQQILINLLTNAIKFTEDEGAVVLMVEYARGESPSRLVFSITDSGIGIPADKQQLIFESFEQADASITREFGGTGLGLTIAEKLVHLMDGEISLRSRPGLGTNFQVEIPLHSASDSEIEPAQDLEPLPVVADGKRILVVEDNKINQLVVKKLLELGGHEVLLAPDGQVGLELYKNSSVDIVLMDIQMPVLDGIETTVQIRELEKKTGQRVPIIALTANAMVGDKEKYLSADMDGYLSKPVKKDQLRAILSRFCSE